MEDGPETDMKSIKSGRLSYLSKELSLHTYQGSDVDSSPRQGHYHEAGTGPVFTSFSSLLANLQQVTLRVAPRVRP